MVKTNEISCNLCDAKASSPLCDGIDRLHGFEGSFSYVRCQNCGLVYMNPQICFEELAQYYPQDYAPHKAAKKSADRKSTKLSIREEYLNRISPQSRVLDVGCGSGGFLASLQSGTGCQVFGLDLSENAVLSASQNFNIDIFKGTIDQAPFENDFFDMITAWSYIEHVNNPRQTLQKMYSLLKPGGYLVLKTPNVASFNACFFKVNFRIFVNGLSRWS